LYSIKKSINFNKQIKTNQMNVSNTTILNTRTTVNGWTINLIIIGNSIFVVSHHDKKSKTSLRYSGKSMDKAIESFLK